jgi:plastocyanin
MHSVSGTRTRLLAFALTACCLGGSVAVAEAATGHDRHSKACRHHPHKHCTALPHHKPATSARGHTQTSGRATHPTPPPPLPSSASAPFSPALTPASPTPPPTAAPETPSEQAPPAGPAHVQVSAKEFNFTLSRAAAPAGHIDIELVDAGEDEHNLHIRPAAGGPDVGALPTLQAGHHEDLEFNLPAGTYTFYCSMPGHEALGMKATFTVQ